MKAKFSISDLLKDSKVALQRFGISIGFAVWGAGIAMAMFKNNSPFSAQNESLLLVLGMGISLFIAIRLYFENNERPIIFNVGVHVLAIAFLVFVYFQILDAKMFGIGNEVLITFRFAIMCHLMVAFLPFIGKNKNIAFWHYNRLLFTRILLTGIFIVTIYAGLAAALGALNALFGVKIESKIYFYLWTILFGPVSVTFFTAGIPKELVGLEDHSEYSNVQRIFVQFVLIPLVLLYLVILYSYFGKILIQTQLPKGYLTYLVNGMLALGIFTYLLGYPYQFISRNKLIQMYTKYFFYLVVVVVAVQFGAIIIRINRYGFTEERYMVLITAVWVLSLIVYFLLFRKKQLLFIPFTMFIAVAISTVGPLSAYNVSKLSQMNRIEKLLRKTKIFDGKKIVPYSKDSTKINLETKSNASEFVSELKYMVEKYDITGAEPWIKIKSKKDIMNDINKNLGEQRFSDRYEIQQIQNDSLNVIFNRLNLEDENDAYNPETVAADRYISFPINEIKLPFAFTQMIEVSNVSKDAEINDTDEDFNRRFKFQIDNKGIVTILKSNKTYHFNIAAVQNIIKNNTNDFNDMRPTIISCQDPNVKVALVLKSLTVNVKNEITSIEGIWLE